MLSTLLKDLFLPVFLILLVIMTLYLQDRLLPVTEVEMCVETIEDSRTERMDHIHYKEVLEWCAAHEDHWRHIIRK